MGSRSRSHVGNTARVMPSDRSSTHPAGAPEADLHRLLVERQRAGKLPSVVAAVSRGDAVLWAGSVGLADVQGQRAATLDTQYRIGSATKTFTAALVLLLRGQTLLELDDRLEQHLPGTPLGRVTLRQLLTHTSGLQREMPGGVWTTFRAPTSDELLAMLGRAEQVVRPGRWHYSNLGYAILGQVIARVTGTSYEAAVEQYLLTPLGLKRTTWTAQPPAARGYLTQPHEDVLTEEPEFDLAAGAAHGQLWSTVGDMLRWAATLIGEHPDVLSSEVGEELRDVHAIADPKGWTRAQGLGLALYRRDDLVLAGHGGGMPGFAAGFVLEPDSGLGAVALGNGVAGFDPIGLAGKLLTTTKSSIEEPAAPWQPSIPCPPDLSSALGLWWSPHGDQLVLAWRDGQLLMEDAGGGSPGTKLERAGADRFRAASGAQAGELLELDRDADGSVVALRWTTYPFHRTFTPVGRRVSGEGRFERQDRSSEEA
jgi:CubicO group peptidase (beta-lactamase class C family)